MKFRFVKKVASLWMLVIPVLTVILVILFYIQKFGIHINPLKENEFGYSAFGQFGDYLGGVLNPILAFINIALIVYYQKVSISKSAEKDILFRMIELQSKILNGIELRPRNDYDENDKQQIEPTTGARAFWIFDKEMLSHYKKRELDPNDTIEKKHKKLVETYYDYFHGSYKKQYLGHYFRNLYHLFKMIDDSDVFSNKEKHYYAKIVRAQLSHLELKFLYLNCIIEDGERFQRYVKKYNILEWIKDDDFDNYDSFFHNSSYIKNNIQSWTYKPDEN